MTLNPPTTYTVELALQAVKAVYASPGGVVGCCLHVITDDGNLENTHVDFCEGYAFGKGHELCQKAAYLIRGLSMTQRRKLYARYSEFATS